MTPRVLVADDDDVVLHSFTQLLRLLGCEVVGVRDGEAARDRLNGRDGRFDLVLLDVEMPRIDGLSLLDAIQETLPALPVLVMSGDPSHAPSALRRGARAFLAKPFGEAVLRRHLFEVLGQLAEHASPPFDPGAERRTPTRATPSPGDHRATAL